MAIRVYTGPKGFVFFIFFIAGIVLFFSVLAWGITKAIELLLPLLIVVSYSLIAVFVLVFLPTTFFRSLRPSLCVYSVLMSYVLGAATWMLSFFFVVKVLGPIGVFLGLLFQFLAPLALGGALFKGAWPIAGHLALWISFTYGMRFYSQWLLNLDSRYHKKDGNIIDVDAIEV